MVDTLDVISQAFGWIYFFAWSISNTKWYITFLLGLYVCKKYNVTGFTFYSVYTITNYIEQRRLDLPHSVTPNDIAFAVHAISIQTVIAVQCCLYKREDHNINRWHMYICATLWVLTIYNCILSGVGIIEWCTQDTNDWNYNTVEFLGYAKGIISFIKYTPQAYMNWRNQSTVGWSIGNVLLDFTGGLFSFLQQFVDAYRKDDMAIFTKNIPKLFLACESMAFDILFIIQHYLLYRHNNGNYVAQADDADPDGHVQQAGALGLRQSPGSFSHALRHSANGSKGYGALPAASASAASRAFDDD